MARLGHAPQPAPARFAYTSQQASTPTPSERLDKAVNGLRRSNPRLSAHRLLTGAQVTGLILCIGAAGMLTLTAGRSLYPFCLAALALLFAAITLLRLYALWYYLTRRRPRVQAAPQAARPQPQDQFLPAYSILVPLYKEAGVVPALMSALSRLDYPSSRMEVLFITEQDDSSTRLALERSGLAPNMRIVTVPSGIPRTKPRALNYALTFATGEYVTVYDAEDAPEPGQLKMAVRAFRTRPGRIGCVQARLDIYTPPANFLTRQFTLEYLILFYALLPAYQRLGIPLPLGGTSNHFPRAILEAAGGWDPFNVTEDADLGLRLARRGYGVAMIGAATWEEAPLRLRPWFGQRTRWIKGWMQTCIVHTRTPWRLLRELGLKGFIGFHVVYAGMLLSAFVHPMAYLLLGYQIATGNGPLSASDASALSLVNLGLASIIASYGATTVTGAAVAIKRRRYGLVLAGLLSPVYWLLISAAAYWALFDLVRRPHHWTKTRHTGAGRHRIDGSGRIRGDTNPGKAH